MDDIQHILDKARVPCDIPGNHAGGSNASEADDSEYTELSSTGRWAQTIHTYICIQPLGMNCSTIINH